MRTYNYHPFINEWLYSVEQGNVYTSNEMKKLMSLVRAVLDSDKVVFNTKIVEDFVDITEKYFFNLMPDQKFYAFLILSLFYKDSGQLVFPEIFLMQGRGWGKNGFISALSFFFISKNYGIPHYDINIVATSEDQAYTSFSDVYEIISNMGAKGTRLFKYNKTEIQSRKTLSRIKYLTSNSKTKDGGRPGCVIFDEVHAYENYDNINVLIGGLGKKPFPRRIYITSDGDIRDGVLDDYKTHAKQILDGETPHDGFLPIIGKLDRIQEVNNQKFWIKANLRLKYSDTLMAETKRQYKAMLMNESLKEAFLTKRMNLPYISKTKTVCTWEDLVTACKGEWADLKSVPCEGGIDFSDLRDFSSVGLRWKVDGITYFKQHTFIHEKALTLTDYGIDIAKCIKMGLATIVKNEDYATISPKLLADWFLEQAKQGAYITKIKCDSFRSAAIKDEFKKSGLPEVVEVRNGAVSHNKVAPIIDLMFADHKVVFEDDILLRWYFWNVKRIVDDKGNVTYRKIEPQRRKTDGFFCFLHTLIDDGLSEQNILQFFDVINL